MSSSLCFQAIDRVHRIGQKKQVHVFRLITENTIDHRIVQRAEIKERLDRVVIQNSRKVDGKKAKDPMEELADIKGRFSKRDKDQLLDVIRFGAQKMLSENKLDVHFDLKKIIFESKLKEDEEKAKLDGMTLEQNSSTTVYQFEGFDFRAKQPIAQPISSSTTKTET